MSRKFFAHLQQSIRDVLDKTDSNVADIFTRKERIYIDDSNPDIYLTGQEARCMHYFLLNYSYKETGKIMQLSYRTVKFYSANMQKRLNCHSKKELIEKVKRS